MLTSGRPGDVRGFVHKRFIRAGRSFITSGLDPRAAATAFLGTNGVSTRSRRSGGKAVARALKFSPGTGASTFAGRVTALRAMGLLSPNQGGTPGATVRLMDGSVVPIAAAEASGRSFSPTIGGVCIPPFRRDPISGECKIFVGSVPGPDPGPTDEVLVNGCPAPGSPDGAPPGRAVREPAMMSSIRLKCPPGYVLGRDELCYFGLPRNSKWRKWRPGRKPKFTAGDLNAIRKADSLSDEAENLFKMTNPAKKAVARNYRANWRKPLKKS